MIRHLLAALILGSALAAVPGAGQRALERQDARAAVGCTTDSDCAARFGGDGSPAPARLIGYGCKGARGPIFRAEEDDFPAPCRDIHEVGRILP